MPSGHFDARTDSIGSEVNASVCIVGAGAAGITLARKLSETIKDVVLIESGGFELEGDTQSLFNGEHLGLRYFNLSACRLRYFGGTTNHWSGFCRANDKIDYEGRPEIGLPAWPVDHDEVEPYIAEAAASLGISGDFFNVDGFVEEMGQPTDSLVDRASPVLQTKVFQIAKDIRLGQKYREAFGNNPNLSVVTYLNLTHIQLADDGRQVSHLDCSTLTGKNVKVTARIFILCCHAIENARQLLTANDITNTGIGNTSGHVGRYFMDHTHIFSSRLIPSERFPVIYDLDFTSAHGLNLNLGFSDNALREKKLAQYYCRFSPVWMEEDVLDSFNSVRDGFFEPGDLDYFEDVTNVLLDIKDVAKYKISTNPILKSAFSRPVPNYYRMDHRLEQVPNPASRVVVSDRRDALGSLIADLDWRITDQDVENFRASQELIGAEISALGFGRVEYETIDRDLVESRIGGHYHQIGTTRMSDAPADGVVDRNQKVHGVENLYIGGSSVFPTAGYSGPTMMIIGFSLRLAEEIKSKINT